MIKCNCDICGKLCGHNDLVELRDKYKIDGAEDLCKECADQLNKAHSEITKITNGLRDSWVVNALRALKEKKLPTKERHP